LITYVKSVSTNSAFHFKLPSDSTPSVLVRLSNGQFVAYEALCTHAGCEVDYDPQSHLLACPCHGAAFDPALSGSAVRRPASRALTTVKISIDGATGAIKVVG
jgi:thiosulfate dehydrogenase [quinone] large subunit